MHVIFLCMFRMPQSIYARILFLITKWSCTNYFISNEILMTDSSSRFHHSITSYATTLPSIHTFLFNTKRQFLLYYTHYNGHYTNQKKTISDNVWWLSNSPSHPTQFGGEPCWPYRYGNTLPLGNKARGCQSWPLDPYIYLRCHLSRSSHHCFVHSRYIGVVAPRSPGAPPCGTASILIVPPGPAKGPSLLPLGTGLPLGPWRRLGLSRRAPTWGLPKGSCPWPCP